MNWDTIEGNWKQFRGKVEQKWGELTDDDLDVIDGKRTELIGRIQERYGKTREAADQAAPHGTLTKRLGSYNALVCIYLLETRDEGDRMRRLHWIERPI